VREDQDKQIKNNNTISNGNCKRVCVVCVRVNTQNPLRDLFSNNSNKSSSCSEKSNIIIRNLAYQNATHNVQIVYVCVALTLSKSLPTLRINDKGNKNKAFVVVAGVRVMSAAISNEW